MGDQDKVLTHAQNFEPHPSDGCHSLPKNGVFPLSFMPYLISPWIGDHMLKKSISNSFWTNFTKSFPVVYIFKFTITTYLKKLIGIKSRSTKQCPAELSPLIIPTVSPILPKLCHLLSSCLFGLPCIDYPAPFPKPTI